MNTYLYVDGLADTRFSAYGVARIGDTDLGRFRFDCDRWLQSRRSGDRNHSRRFGRSRRSAPIRAALRVGFVLYA